MILGKLHFKKATALFPNKKYITLIRDILWHDVKESYWLVGTINDMHNKHFIFNPCHIYLCKNNSFHIHEILPNGARLPISLIYYELDPQRQKIQANMEERTLQLILKHVVNDLCFEYNGSIKN